MSREPLQAALGEIAHRTPSGEVGEEAFGGAGSEVGDLAGFGCWAASPCLPHSREVARVVPRGEGTTVLPRLGTHTFRAPGAQAMSSVKRGVSGRKPQDTDGGCGTSPRCSLPRGRLYGVLWSQSRLCRGGAATGSWHHARPRPGPGGQRSRGQPGRQRPGRGLGGQDPLGQPRGGGAALLPGTQSCLAQNW